MLYIYSHNPHSKGAKALAEALGIKRIKHENSRFRGKPETDVINWGASRLPEEVLKCQVLNTPKAVDGVADKLKFFQTLKEALDHLTPRFTTSSDEAKQWVREGEMVVCRTVLRGSGGEGIVLASSIDEVVDAPLYVQYKKKKEEFRVHMFGDKVIDVQRKALRNGNDPHRIRNLANGYVFQRNDIMVPDDVFVVAADAKFVSGLDFGAIDVIWNQREERAYVLEINTAPGLMGTTVQSYAAGVLEYLEG